MDVPVGSIDTKSCSFDAALKRILSRKMFDCPGCLKVFPKEINLNQHMKRIHKQIINAFCDKCDYSTWSMDNLRQHVKRKHGKIQYPRSRCDVSTSSKKNIKRQINAGHEQIKVRDKACTKCAYVTNTSSNLRHHIKRVHQRIRICKVCRFSTNDSKDMKNHKKQVHDKCGECSYISNCRSIMARHIERKHNKISLKTVADRKLVYVAEGLMPNGNQNVKLESINPLELGDRRGKDTSESMDCRTSDNKLFSCPVILCGASHLSPELLATHLADTHPLL